MRPAALALPLVAAALTAGAGALYAQTRPAAPATIDVDELRPGMRGYGLTIFRGARPERFDVEVIDVLHDFRPRQDLVLIRSTHPVIVRAGTIGGMSGSPIYINDRLMGAYAYGWEFGREPVAGVTPISSMLDVLRRPRRTPPGIIPGETVPLPVQLARAEPWNTLRERHALTRAPVPTPYGTLVPATTPLIVGGMAPRALAHLTESLEDFGLVPLQAGGSGPSTPPADAPARYENGGALAIRAMQGDITGNITGTVTLTRDEGVLAFGHPMMSLGEIGVPAAIARVLWVLSNERRSFKISEPVRNLGALVQDRGAAVVVDPRAEAAVIPIRVRVRGADGAPHPDWNVSVTYQRPLASRLVGSVVESALESTASDTGDAAWTVRSRVRIAGRNPVEVVDHGTGGEGYRGIRSFGGLELVQRVIDNAFGSARVEGLDVDIDLRWASEYAYVRSVSVDRAEVEPGSTVTLRVTLGRYGAPPETRNVRVEIPRELAGQEVELEVAGGHDAQLDLPEPESLDDLIRNIQTRLPGDALVVSLRMPGQGVTLRGRTVPNLPGSAFDALRPSASSDTGEPLANLRRTVVPVGRVVVGRDRVRLRAREITR